jgi:hypothetical protein
MEKGDELLSMSKVVRASALLPSSLSHVPSLADAFGATGLSHRIGTVRKRRSLSPANTAIDANRRWRAL